MSAVDSQELNEKNTNAHTRPTLIWFSGDLQCTQTQIQMSIGQHSIRHRTQIHKVHAMIYCMNLRQVTSRLCRLCRQHCQIISLICSIRIGKVYIQPRASYSNIILKLFSVKFTVWLPLFSCSLTKIWPGSSSGILSPNENIPHTFSTCIMRSM